VRAEQVTGPVAYHGEGPVWLPGQGLHWVDMLAGDLLSWDEAGEVVRQHVGDALACVRPRRGGGRVFAVQRGFALDDGPGTDVRPLPELWSDPGIRMNEGGCDPAGNLWCGSMAYDGREGAGAMYRLSPDGTAEQVESGWTIPNGLDWTSDGSTAYHNDTANGRILVLSWDAERGLHDGRTFVEVEGGNPDGLCVDADDGVWTAVWGGGAVHHYDPDGRLVDVVEVPASQVSACTFGGPDLDTLYITTSREGLDDPEPQAGALFAVPGAGRGRPPRPFAG
jgi:sugar lactone lactonase YvrE